MTDYEDYAIVSKKEFLALKKELDKLKQDPLSGSPSGETLQDSIDNLNKSLNGMMGIFRDASEDMKLEERETEMISKRMEPMVDKIDKLIEQNQKIAKGIVAVADMVKDKLDEIGKVPEPRMGTIPNMYSPEDREPRRMERPTRSGPSYSGHNSGPAMPQERPSVPPSSISSNMKSNTSSIPSMQGAGSMPSPGTLPKAATPPPAPSMPPPPPKPKAM